MKRYKVCLEESHKSAIIRDSKNYDVLVVDSVYTKTDIEKIHKNGCKTVLCYLNYGMAETDWSDFKKYKSICIAKNEDWSHEYWVNVTSSIWKQRIKSLVLNAKAKGFDGIWLDNGDIYWYILEEKKNKSLANNIYSAMVEMCKWIKSQNMILILNGADTFVSKLIDQKKQSIIDGVNQETVYSRIKSYSGNGTFGEQCSSDHSYFKSYCKRCKKYKLLVFLLEYTKSNSLIKRIKNFCTNNKIDGYCISSSIKL